MNNKNWGRTHILIINKTITQHQFMCVCRKYHLKYQIKQTKGYYTNQKIK